MKTARTNLARWMVGLAGAFGLLLVGCADVPTTPDAPTVDELEGAVMAPVECATWCETGAIATWDHCLADGEVEAVCAATFEARHEGCLTTWCGAAPETDAEGVTGVEANVLDTPWTYGVVLTEEVIPTTPATMAAEMATAPPTWGATLNTPAEPVHTMVAAGATDDMMCELECALEANKQYVACTAGELAECNDDICPEALCVDRFADTFALCAQDVCR